MLDPIAYLRDIINDPARAEMPTVRRMALRITGWMPDPQAAAKMQDRLINIIQILLEACQVQAVEDSPSLFEIGVWQMQARALLVQARKGGRW